MVGGVLAGCQSYEARPLDPEAHREAWRGRTLEGESLADFLERLEARTGDVVDALDPSDGLSLREAQLVALVYNPGLRLARLRLGRAEASAAEAGRWNDPALSLSVLNITDDVPDPWLVSTGLSLSLPLSGRLGAERGLAEAEQLAAEASLLEEEWAVWRDVRSAWIEWSAARLRVEETERFATEVAELLRGVTELEALGEVPRTEAALFRLELGARQNQLRGLRGEVDALEHRLLMLLGLPPVTSIELLPSLAEDDADAAAEAEALERRNPGLARLRQEHEVAEARLRREIRKQYPDLILGPLFESEQGQSRIGLSGAIPLPVLNANRRGIAEARAERKLARETVESTLELLVGRWEAARVRAEALADQREDMAQVLVPLVDRQLADATELMRLGEADSTLVLLESLVRSFETRIELIDTRSAEALARTEAVHLIGPQLADAPPETTQETP